jgi:hypothetical protein
MREEFRQRLGNEYRYAVTKMQETPDSSRKLFYFSAFFGEAQRILNWEWDCDLALIYAITLHVYTQFSTPTQVPGFRALPINWKDLYEKLTQVASDLATHFEKTGNQDNKEELLQIFEVLAEIAYAVSGNGSYLLEKGSFKV